MFELDKPILDGRRLPAGFTYIVSERVGDHRGLYSVRNEADLAVKDARALEGRRVYRRTKQGWRLLYWEGPAAIPSNDCWLGKKRGPDRLGVAWK